MSTPTRSAAPADALTPSDSPGTWRHPRLDEITRRRSATVFSEKNVRRIAYNFIALLTMWSLKLAAKRKLDPHILSLTLRSYLSWAWFALQLVPITQMGLACMPLFRAPDDLSDIPLTAAQRKLLNLPPSSALPNPNDKIRTPPRYARTPSRTGSVGGKASYSNSPFSGRGSPAFPVTGEESPSSLSTAGSPLLQRSVNALARGQRSFSIGSASPYGAVMSNNIFSDSDSPSPSGGKRTSVGLNSKWLYEKGRHASGNAWLYTDQATAHGARCRETSHQL